VTGSLFICEDFDDGWDLAKQKVNKTFWMAVEMFEGQPAQTCSLWDTEKEAMNEAVKMGFNKEVIKIVIKNLGLMFYRRYYMSSKTFADKIVENLNVYTFQFKNQYLLD
jgi:hypothetical protein